MKGVLLVVLLSGVAFGQTIPAAFESADVRVSAPSTNPTMRGGALRGGRYEVRTATMVNLISMAYSMESDTNPMLNRLLTCQNTNMTQFATTLQYLAGGYVRAPVKDATGLEGYWDFTVNFSGVNLRPGARFDPNAASGATDPNGSLTLPEAQRKQLGLKLELEKRPLPVLVVDHVEDKPTEN
jgi:hypothetical protein